MDLGYIGLPFTWDNRQQGGQNIKVRLDRGFATSAFFQVFQEVKLWHVQTTEFDNCAIVIECLVTRRMRRKRKQFRYENMWRRDPSYLETIRGVWSVDNGPSSLDQVRDVLGRVQSSFMHGSTPTSALSGGSCHDCEGSWKKCEEAPLAQADHRRRKEL